MIKNSTLILIIFLAGCSSVSFDSPDDILSFHYGYVVQKEFESTGTSQNLDQFRAGMEAARKGEPFPISDEVLRDVFAKFEENELEKQKTKNLAEAENYLRNISLDPSVKELIPERLYYMELKEGEGQLIKLDDLLLVNYNVAVLESGKENNIYSPETSPTPISIEDTIPGFSQGVKGMQIGERRKLYIHPELAYGTFGGKIEPNQLLIIDVEAVDVSSDVKTR